MAASQPYSVTMSQEEILLLSSKLHVPLMFGVDLKMLELPREEQQALMESAERSLLARDFVRPSIDNSLRLAPILTAILVTCAKPERTVVVTRTEIPQPPTSLMFHISMQTIVNHSVSDSGTHTFILLPELNTMLDALLDLAQAASFANPKCPGASFPESVYLQANQFAQENNPGSLFTLLAKALPEPTAVAFHRTLDHHAANVSVVRMLHGDQPADTLSEGFTLLQGGDIQWILRTSGTAPERTMTIEGASIREVRSEIKRLLRRR